jgi:hypothetical protein
MHTATTESVSLCADAMLTAFLELESAALAGGELS